MKQWTVWIGILGLGAVALQTVALNVRATERAYSLGGAVRVARDLDVENAHLRTKLRSVTASQRLEVARSDLGLSEDDLCPLSVGWRPSPVALAERP